MPGRYITRHGAMRFLGEFTAPEDAMYLLGEPTHGQILRLLSADDQAQWDRARAQEQHEMDTCCRIVGQRRLQMELVDVEHLFGGERIVFYFLAEKRVDFRDLVKDLARTFQTRIEMRQIGVRDEAKLLADYGDCGKPVCCNTHMAKMPPVSMRMAKLQKSTLDPSKISGRCGRLKCCLRFEQDVYEEFQAELPAIGARVLTAKGQGRVLAQEVLARKVLVEFEDGRRIPVAAGEILTQLGR